MSLLRRALYTAGAFIVIGAIGIGGTVVGVEKSCVSHLPTPAVNSDFAITDQGYARPQGDSFLTFPEWYIVHAYNDLAGVTARSSESGFDYLASIGGFWTSLCGATRQASTSGPASADQKATNYIIGFSFTVEMGLMGAYERTIGALTEWTAGGRRTAEDEFNLALLKEYGAFLYQTPWFRFPFGAKLRQFWRETPFVPSIRAVERRGSLSLQYAARYAYARLMRFVAGYDPADLTIRSVVGGLTPSDLAAMHDVKVIREVTDTTGVRGVLVETARYAAFDAFVKELGRRANASLLEVAGNHHILVTIVAPETGAPGTGAPEGTDAKLAAADGVTIFGLPIQSLPGSRRIGMDVPVRSLVQDVKNIEAAGYRFEHAYDY
jgi:hypothetical protein